MISCDPRAFALRRPWAGFFGPFGPLGLGRGWGGDKAGTVLLRWGAGEWGRGGDGLLAFFDAAEHVDEGVFEIAFLAMEVGDGDAVGDEFAEDAGDDIGFETVDAEACAGAAFFVEGDHGCGEGPLEESGWAA